MQDEALLPDASAINSGETALQPTGCFRWLVALLMAAAGVLVLWTRTAQVGLPAAASSDRRSASWRRAGRSTLGRARA